MRDTALLESVTTFMAMLNISSFLLDTCSDRTGMCLVDPHLLFLH
ncbi:MAG: hypothetical protein BWY93_00117 [Euryarchaeota archaeon ADurb.BinA087]|nr:MAG: hypothetical protein BWY93_00117 [Euryarchaeota archaeon ADurb.BinA087]